jgi:hypothetical protein
MSLPDGATKVPKASAMTHASLLGGSESERQSPEQAWVPLEQLSPQTRPPSLATEHVAVPCPDGGAGQDCAPQEAGASDGASEGPSAGAESTGPPLSTGAEASASVDGASSRETSPPPPSGGQLLCDAQSDEGGEYVPQPEEGPAAANTANRLHVVTQAARLRMVRKYLLLEVNGALRGATVTRTRSTQQRRRAVGWSGPVPPSGSPSLGLLRATAR